MFQHETSRFAIPAVIRTHRSLIALAVALIAVAVYGVREHSVAAHYSAQSAQASVQTQDLRSQVNALTAKLDELASKQAAPPQVPTVTVTRHVVLKPTASRQKPDPRWKKFQAQLDEQGKQIESTKQEIADAFTHCHTLLNVTRAWRTLRRLAMLRGRNGLHAFRGAPSR